MIHKILPLKATDELLQWISKHYDVSPLPLSTFSTNFIQAFAFTILHSESHKSNPDAGDKLNFISYRLLPTERNQRYFDFYHGKYFEDLIYLVLETENRCHTSNSYLLDLEVHLAWGLSEHDIKNRTILYDEYVWNLDCLDKLDIQ